MNKKLIELLKRIGFTDAQIATASKAEDFDADEMFEEVNGAIGKALSQDPAFTDPIRQAATAEVLSSKERHILKLAGGKITQEELDALPKKDRFNKLVDLYHAKVVPAEGGNKSADDKDKEIARLNTEVQSLTNTVTDYKDVKLPAAKKAAEQVAENFHIDAYLHKVATGGGRKTVLAAEKVTALLRADMSEEADLRWDPTTKTVILKKKGEDVDLYDAKDRSKPMSAEALAVSLGDKNGYFAKNNGNGGNNGNNKTVDPAPAPAGVNEPPGIAAARARKAAQQA